ncbi:MAG: hypothetical protein H6845_02120 [Alphaproteobacteria bacterium]|nr:MAG: hypothetical protein H6845_02120 [Alphaproteobacteria bacterium]
MLRKVKAFRKIKAFSLLEVSFILIIIGLITFGGLKGWELVGRANYMRVANDLRHYAIAVQIYKSHYGSAPYLDDTGSLVSQEIFWKKLKETNLVNVENIPPKTILGEIRLKLENGRYALVLGVFENDVVTQGVSVNIAKQLQKYVSDLDFGFSSVVGKRCVDHDGNFVQDSGNDKCCILHVNI